MELSIKNLAIPRKQIVLTKTATCTKTSTDETYERMNITLPDAGLIKYYPRIYEGAPADTTPFDNYLCHAYVYTNTNASDITKGRLLYHVIPTDRTVDGMSVLEIRCEKPDGTYFNIDPGYYLGSYLYCVGIKFKWFRYSPRDGSARQTYNESVGFAPQTRYTKTADYENFECTIGSGVFDITVEIDVYNSSRHEMVDSRIVNSIDSDSYMGRGGLNSYRLCCGVEYKDKYEAYADPSGKWYTDDITRKTDIDVQYTWT